MLFLDKIFLRNAAQFLTTFSKITPESNADGHPLNKLYELPAKRIQEFLLNFDSTRAFSPRVSKNSMDRTVVTLEMPDDDIIEKIRTEHPEAPFLMYSCFQKFYKDGHGQLAKNVTLKGKFGQTLMELNNIGVIGGDLAPEQRVNLFVGASELYSLSVSQLGMAENLLNVIKETEVPFNEMGINLNASIEGASFPYICGRAKAVQKAIIEQDAIIENLFVFGGWHNLIYNKNTEEDWRGYCEEISGYAPRTCFFEIASPLISSSFEDIKAFNDRGHPFWGDMECSEENYTRLRDKILEYNNWLKAYCAEKDNLLFIPTQSFFEYEASEIENWYMDVNHFANNHMVREKVNESLNDVLMENSDFFAPQIGAVSEYVYPTF